MELHRAQEIVQQIREYFDIDDSAGGARAVDQGLDELLDGNIFVSEYVPALDRRSR